jgi:hypothetical protein
MQECCTSNQKAVEKLQEAMENQIKNLKSELAQAIQEKLDEILKDGTQKA